MQQIIFKIVLALNTIWFGMAFWFFSQQSHKAAKLLITKAERDNALFPTLAYSLKFLGGMNLSISILALLLLLFDSNLFPQNNQKALFALFFTLANGSQFFYNIPIAFSEYRREKTIWSVLRGQMFFIL